MKRRTAKLSRWLKKRARNQAKRQSRKFEKTELVLYSSELGQQLVHAGGIRPLPKILCLDLDLSKTLNFFHKFRKDTKMPMRNFSKAPTSKKKGRIKQLRNYYDFVPLAQITPGAALMLAAEFDRLNALAGRKPTTINIDKWNDHVYGMLFHLGFFKLLGFSENRIKRQAINRPPVLANLIIMPMESGTVADLAVAVGCLQELFSKNGAEQELSLKLNSAIFDAVENVVSHAYNDLSINDQKLIPRKWWISGAANSSNRSITVSIFDQGITIPVSLPAKWSREKPFTSVMSKLGFSRWKDGQDGDAVKAAMMLAATSTEISNRGKGLHKIKEIMGELKGGSLLILSRKGYYKWENGLESCYTMENSLLGTYVELKADF
jgi:hypothetical protein